MRRTDRQTLLTAALTAVLLQGCTADRGEETQRDSRQTLIALTAQEVRDVTETATRGTQLTKTTMTRFGVSASCYDAAETYTDKECGTYFHNLEVDAATGYTGYFWPGERYRISFFAYAPYGNSLLAIGTATDRGYPKYHYTVPTAVTEQIDFVTAAITDHNGAGREEPLGLTFTHRLADIRFVCENIGAEEATLKSVTVCGMKYSGVFSGDTWTLDDTANTTTDHPFTLSVERIISPDGTIDVTGTTGHFIMLPQTVEAGTPFLDVHATVAGETAHYCYTLPGDMTLEAGKVYTFRLILSDQLTVDQNTDIKDWDEETDRTGIPANQNVTTDFVTEGWTKEQ